MGDKYDFWRAKLAGQPTDAFDKVAHPGFYRTGRGEPVAVWEHEGEMVGQVGSRPPVAADAGFCETIFADACMHPVTHEAYTTAVAGGPWPDMDATVHAQINAPKRNEPADEAEVLRDQIEAAAAGAGEYAKIEDDETSARAQSLRARLLELKGTVEKRHKAEKAPHLEAGRAVDQKWFPLRDTAEEKANALRKAMSVWETEKARRADEERRRLEAERREAEAKRLAAEEAARLAAEAGKPAPVVELPPEPAPMPEPAPVATQVKGAYGRAAAVKVIKVATVVDQDAAYQAMRTHPELKALIATLAQRAVNAGHAIAGIEVTEERRVA